VALRVLLRHCLRPRLALPLHAVATAPLASLESVLLPPSPMGRLGGGPLLGGVYPSLFILRASPPNQSPSPFR
jgi:hypothetical protein